jgi:hypothetical protein
LLKPWGLGIERGIVFEGDPNYRFPNDPTRPVVIRYLSGIPIVNRLPPTFFPGAEALTTPASDRAGLVVSVLARTSPLSYLSRHPLSGTFDPGVDIQGPIDLIATAELPGNLNGQVRRTRLVAVSNTAFASNGFINEAGNSTLFIRSMDWATLEENLVTVNANLPRIRPLSLTEGRLTYIRVVGIAVVPLLFVLLGTMVWVLRRPR